VFAAAQQQPAGQKVKSGAWFFPVLEWEEKAMEVPEMEGGSLLSTYFILTLFACDYNHKVA